MNQTPAHDQHNPDLLAFIPREAKRLVEVGCSSGALARAFKRFNKNCHYTGIEIDAEYAELSKHGCDVVINASIEELGEARFTDLSPVDCWIFGDTLEHLRDPWAVLRRIRQNALQESSVVACIPNSQHWSMQVRLNSGQFWYEDAGLLDRTHLRFFTRTTMIQLFESTGFKIVDGKSRIFNPPSVGVENAIEALAIASGADPDRAVDDAMALQYVVRAVPA